MEPKLKFKNMSMSKVEPKQTHTVDRRVSVLLRVIITILFKTHKEGLRLSDLDIEL